MVNEAQGIDERHWGCRIEGDGGDLPMASQIHEPNGKSRFRLFAQYMNDIWLRVGKNSNRRTFMAKMRWFLLVLGFIAVIFGCSTSSTSPTLTVTFGKTVATSKSLDTGALASLPAPAKGQAELATISPTGYPA
jgi:hypothetical protein